MALTEYKPGTTFPGVIGRTPDVRSPRGRRPTGRRTERRMFCLSFLTTPASGTWAATAVRSTHRTSMRWPPTDCAIATCTRPRSVRHRARAFSLAATTIPTTSPVSPNGSTGYPGSDGYIPFENGFLSEILLQKGYNTYCVGKWHLAPRRDDRQPALTTAGRWDAASNATTASWAATPTNTTRNSCGTIRRPNRKKLPKRATTSR